MQEPGPDDVLLHVRATGICGSDIHFWRHGGIGDITVDGDCILGHEASAVVLKVGSNVKNVKAGKTGTAGLKTSQNLNVKHGC